MNTCRWCKYEIYFEVINGRWVHSITFDGRREVPACEPDMQSQFAEPEPEPIQDGTYELDAEFVPYFSDEPLSKTIREKLRRLTGRLPSASGDPGWWAYAEKDAWADFEKAHPREAKAIVTLVLAIWFTPENTTDSVLTSGVQIEGLFLRVAELLGMVEVERLP